MPPGSNAIPNHVLNRRRNDITDVQTGGGDDPAAAMLETESNTVARFPE